MNKMLAGALFAAGLATTACSSFSKEAKETNPAPCPNVLVLTEAGRLIEFDGEERLEDVAYSAEIMDVTVSCRYFGDKPIELEVDLDFAFGRGPKGAAGQKVFKYFVAVTRTNLEVIAKKDFAVAADFKGDRVVVVTTEKIDKIVIPRKDSEVSGLNFEIIVGMSLEPDQMRFNRSGKSLKFPRLK
jgi:hypothetical protein